MIFKEKSTKCLQMLPCKPLSIAHSPGLLATALVAERTFVASMTGGAQKMELRFETFQRNTSEKIFQRMYCPCTRDVELVMHPL
jgi:hypothetical protein